MQISVRASSEPGHNLAPPPNPKKGNLVPASCHAHDISSVHHHHHQELVHKKNHNHHLQEEEGEKKSSRRNSDSNIIYSSWTIDVKLKLQ
jgi:hypothetical protein